MGIETALIAGGLGLAGSLIAGNETADAQRDAARSATNSATQQNDAALDFAREQYYNNIALTDPWRQSGENALNEMNALMGLPSVQTSTQRNALAQSQADINNSVLQNGGTRYENGVPVSGYTSQPVTNPGQYTVNLNDQGQFVVGDSVYAGGVPGDVYNAFYDERPDLYSPIQQANMIHSGDYTAADFTPGMGGVGYQLANKTTPTTTPINALADASATPNSGTPATTFQADETISTPQHAAYQRFLDNPHTSAQMNALRGQTDYTMDMLTGNAAANGMALSGAHLTDLYDTSRRDEYNAMNALYTDYTNTLGRMSGTGQGTATNQANMGTNLANTGVQIAGMNGQNALANAQIAGSSYQNQANAFNQGLGNALTLGAYGWGQSGFGSGGLTATQNAQIANNNALYGF